MCSETSSPRLSFSSDLGQGQPDVLPLQDHHRRDTSLLDMACDFEFSFTSSFSAQESSSADELFSHGIILPTQPSRNTALPSRSEAPSLSNPNSLPPLPNFPENIIHPKGEKQKEITCDSNKPQSKSFWGTFKRSNSLNCENKRQTLLCPLPLLSRSNSTGSVLNQKRNSFKESMKGNSYSSSSSSSSQKKPLISMARSSSSSSSSSLSNNSYAAPQKPPLKKSYGGSYGNGDRIIHLINIPPPYISKCTAKLFGLSSFLHNGKDKKAKK